MKKSKFIICLMLGVLCFALWSCNKHDDDDDDWGNGNSGGGGIWNPTIIDGKLPGLFSVSQDQQVQFSQGNLQYQASTNTWRFAENQWDIIGEANSNISQSYSDWIDLFGWGTSGWNNGNVYYQPYDYEYLTDLYNGHGYGPTNGTNHYFNLTNEFANADWGINNPILNGGNTSHYWRTLTNAEWIYVFNTRTTTSGIRYAKAQVNGTNGVILVPDDWIVSTFSLNKTNKTDANYNSNIVDDLVWRNTFEPAGAVFLPAAGNRNETSVYHIGGIGYYWSSSVDSSHGAHMVSFANSSLYPGNTGSSYFGLSVRLVHSTQNNSESHIEVTTNNVTDITPTTAVCGGNVTVTGNGTVTARGVCWSTNPNPTINDNHTNNSAGTGSFTSSITGLAPNTTYYVRAYATNSVGTSYGAQKSFTTTAIEPIDYASDYVGNYLGQFILTITSMNNNPTSSISFPIDDIRMNIIKGTTTNTLTAIVTINDESHQTSGVAMEEKAVFEPFHSVIDRPELNYMFNLDFIMEGTKTGSNILTIVGTFSGNGSASIMGYEQFFDEISGPLSGELMKQ